MTVIPLFVVAVPAASSVRVRESSVTFAVKDAFLTQSQVLMPNELPPVSIQVPSPDISNF